MSNLIRFMRGVRIQAAHFQPERLRWRSLDKTKLLVPFRLFFHPVETMNDIKFEGRGSLALANLLAFLYFVGQMMAFSMTGYLFNAHDIRQFNLFLILAQTVVVLLLWAVCNWSSCTLLEGEGTFRQIWIATCYSLMPMVLGQLPLLLASRILSLSESMFLTAATAVLQGWSLLLLFLGMMVMHQFTVARTVGSVLITLVLLAAVAFLALLSFSIFQQLVAFIGTVARRAGGTIGGTE